MRRVFDFLKGGDEYFDDNCLAIVWFGATEQCIYELLGDEAP